MRSRMALLSLLAALGLCAVSWQAPAADSADGRYQYEATAAPTCTFTSGFSARAAQNMTFSGTGAVSGAVTITAMIDDTTAHLKPATIQLAARAICNHPHHLSLRTARGALIAEANQGVSAAGFLKEVRYQASATWGPHTATLTTDGTPGLISAPPANAPAQAGDLTLEIRIDGTSNNLETPVLAGTYLDILTIQIGALL